MLIPINLFGQIYLSFLPKQKITKTSDKQIYQIFQKKYSTITQKEELSKRINKYILENNFYYWEFDDSEPYDRRFAYWWLHLTHGNLGETEKKQHEIYKDLHHINSLSMIRDTAIIKEIYRKNKNIFLYFCMQNIQKNNIDFVISDLLACYKRLNLLSEAELAVSQNTQYLHWGYIQNGVRENKKLNYHKPSFYIDWLYYFWIQKKKDKTSLVFYEILLDISKHFLIRKEEYSVWKWDQKQWEDNIKK